MDVSLPNSRSMVASGLVVVLLVLWGCSAPDRVTHDEPMRPGDADPVADGLVAPGQEDARNAIVPGPDGSADTSVFRRDGSPDANAPGPDGTNVLRADGPPDTSVAGPDGPYDVQAPPPANGLRFMAFPSSDPGVKFGQAWYYESTGLKDIYCSYPAGDIAGYGRHCAIDYGKRDASNRPTTFPVTAVAAGIATGSRQAGTISVLHDARDTRGRQYCTVYKHLDTNQNVIIPVGASRRVNQGEVIGWSWNTRTAGIHLHLETYVGGCYATAVDPYDISPALLDRKIAPVKVHYPGGASFKGCGPNALWLQCNR
jgi:hypothetical protein